MKKVFWFLWVLFFIADIVHYVYTALKYNDLYVADVEHIFYTAVLGLAAISMSEIKKGKIILYFLCFLLLGTIDFLPEFEQITALDSCAEGKCEVARNMGIIKTQNNVTECVPQSINKGKKL
ncbi:MAG: hypothetical protein IJ689_04465 [Alphaproteobacteria bacterium]|nr:hypothetical protein [Alphaproteobacteria bacterium]